MTKDTFLRIATRQAEHAFHIYNVDSMKHAIRDYNRLSKKDQLNVTQKVRLAEAESSLRESQNWLRQVK